MSETCPNCNGTGSKIIGTFMVFDKKVSLENRFRMMAIDCDVCVNGLVDDEYKNRRIAGMKLRLSRIDHDLSLREFSRKFGLNVVTVSDMERGKKLPDEEAAKILSAHESLKNGASHA